MNSEAEEAAVEVTTVEGEATTTTDRPRPRTTTFRKQVHQEEMFKGERTTKVFDRVVCACDQDHISSRLLPSLHPS